ncbi:hypothetical protein NX059_010968 [Plenodomus lindquistii]|nr:hypothetical protein NX059_010968 [Plenodomus lindquistii]
MLLGQTSTFSLASSLGKRLESLEDVIHSPTPAKRRRIAVNLDYATVRDDNPSALGLDDLTSCCDYVVPTNSLRTDRYLREAVADRHLESFFNTIHIFLPILDPDTIRARYLSLRRLFGDRRLMFATSDDTSRPQFVCLLHALLALGALYEDGEEDSSSWASWYFAEAQDMLGRLLDASNLHLVQAATFLGAYAQHAIKPNLAYILTGIATRLAFSIGLNVETLHASLGFDSQEARRTWSIIYIQEVELSLDAGRPMSLRSSEMNMSYPTVKLPMGDGTSAERAQAVFIQYLGELAKVVKVILESSGDGNQQREVLRQRLETWRASLPEHLKFGISTGSMSRSQPPFSFLRDWKLRQQSSLRIRKSSHVTSTALIWI